MKYDVFYLRKAKTFYESTLFHSGVTLQEKLETKSIHTAKNPVSCHQILNGVDFTLKDLSRLA